MKFLQNKKNIAKGRLHAMDVVLNTCRPPINYAAKIGVITIDEKEQKRSFT